MSAWRRLPRTLPGLVSSLPRVRQRSPVRCGLLTCCQSFSTTGPLRDNLIADFKRSFPGLSVPNLGVSRRNYNYPPEEADIVIIGGGVVGWSIAYWLKLKDSVHGALKIVVLEKDLTYSAASTVLSAGGIRQQFSLPENISLSLFSAEFMRDINQHLGIMNMEPVDLQFNQSGYLMLADEERAPIMEENFQTQKNFGAKTSLLSATQVKERFPWINTEGVALASYGLENEGWFDPWSLLNAFKRKATSLGVISCYGEVTGAKTVSSLRMDKDGETRELKRIGALAIKLPHGIESVPLKCSIVVNAAGHASGEVARRLGAHAGTILDDVGVVVPVEPRKRFIYVVHCPDGPGLETPFLIDYSGVYFRREGLGGYFITGRSPEEGEEPDTRDLEVDHQFFQDHVWPQLASRVPAFEKLKVTSAWAGFYDYNAFDQNGIIGSHPFLTNMYMACGFSGHGLQQSPGVGRAIAELILDSRFVTLDLSAMSFDRIVRQEPMLERNIV